jgi:NTP pyrophosphatase (non-canonical NTP hydrolase)
MMEEVLELIGAMDATPTDDGPTNLYAVIEEAVDVTNYCMMLADVARAQIRREERGGASEGLNDRAVSGREPTVCQEPERGGRDAG